MLKCIEKYTMNDKKLNTWYVQPGAKHTEIAGLHGDALKIRLTSRPIDGEANDALLHYIAKLFDISFRQVVLKQGDKSRHKTLHISLNNPLRSCWFSRTSASVTFSKTLKNAC